jgi:hypothetical protein
MTLIQGGLSVPRCVMVCKACCRRPTTTYEFRGAFAAGAAQMRARGQNWSAWLMCFSDHRLTPVPSAMGSDVVPKHTPPARQRRCTSGRSRVRRAMQELPAEVVLSSASQLPLSRCRLRPWNFPARVHMGEEPTRPPNRPRYSAWRQIGASQEAESSAHIPTQGRRGLVRVYAVERCCPDHAIFDLVTPDC